MPPKLRLDQLLVNRALAPTRSRAQALILAGNVLVNDQPVTKAGTAFADDVRITLRQPDHPYVGRGGLKLAHALQEFSVDPTGCVCLDAGASTGGFTDCLLQHGATKIYAVDVGHGQLAWKLQQDARVIRIDQCNLRTIESEKVPEPIDLVTLDLSFISLTKVFPVVHQLVRAGGTIIALIKPQFEVGRAAVGKGGIVRDDVARQGAVDNVLQSAAGLGWQHVGTTTSPIQGADGNIEFLAAWRRGTAGEERGEE